MKDNDESIKQVLENMKNLTGLAQKVADVSKNTVPALLEKMMAELSTEDRAKAQNFVQDSNTLLQQAGKLDFVKVQELIKKHEQQHGKSDNNK